MSGANYRSYHNTPYEQLISMLNNTVRDGECMIWKGKADPDGYVRLRWAGRRWTAHRLVLLLWNYIDLNSEIFALHKAHCHNHACINPDHLYGGTQKDNIADEIKAGNHMSQQPHNYEKSGQTRASVRRNKEI